MKEGIIGTYIATFKLTNSEIICGAWREEIYIRPVLTLKDDVEFSGAGTEESPYIVSNY